jgi:hypothetical protein
MASLFLYRMPLFKSCKPPLCPFRTLLASIFRELAPEFYRLISKQISSCRARIRVFIISNLPLNQSSFKSWPCLLAVRLTESSCLVRVSCQGVHRLRRGYQNKSICEAYSHIWLATTCVCPGAFSSYKNRHSTTCKALGAVLC